MLSQHFNEDLKHQSKIELPKYPKNPKGHMSSSAYDSGFLKAFLARANMVIFAFSSTAFPFCDFF